MPIQSGPMPIKPKNPLVDKTASSIDRLSSGKRFNSAASNPAAVAIISGLTAEISGLQQAGRNTLQASSMLNVAGGGLQTTSDTLARMKEIAVQAANDSISDTERGFLQNEMDRLVERLDQTANTSEFNGKNLLNGSEGTLSFQVGTGSDASNQITFDTPDATAAGLGLEGASVGTAEDARGMLGQLEDSINQLNDMQSQIGATSNTLSVTSDNLVRAAEANQIARGQMADTDFAAESASLATSMVQTQFGIAMQAQANASVGITSKLLG